MPRIARGTPGLGAEDRRKNFGGARRKGRAGNAGARPMRTTLLHFISVTVPTVDFSLIALPGCTQERVVDAMRARGIDVAPPTATKDQSGIRGTEKSSAGRPLCQFRTMRLPHL